MTCRHDFVAGTEFLKRISKFAKPRAICSFWISDVQISWQAQPFVNLDAQVSWQAQHFVNLDVQIAWQAQHFVNLDVQISWQAQHFVNLDAQISWQAQHEGFFLPTSIALVATPCG